MTAVIAREIKALHKGRGLGASDLDQRVGPALRELVLDGNGENQAGLRVALATMLSRCAARLDDDQRTHVLAGLGLAPGTTHLPHFGDRVSWVAERINRNYRTALRRLAEAEDRLAEEVARELAQRRGRPAATAHGWYLEEFRTVYRLDCAVPQAHEYRRVVAVQQGLTEVEIALDVPHDRDRQRPHLSAEVVFGGRLIRRVDPSRTRTQFVIQLPAPLLPGQSHDFEVILRAPAGADMHPHYIFTPELQCDSFDLRVRFDPRRLPAWVRRVDGEPVRTFDDARPTAQRVTVDAAGEAHASFTGPALYLGYGLQWQSQLPLMWFHAGYSLSLTAARREWLNFSAAHPWTPSWANASEDFATSPPLTWHFLRCRAPRQRTPATPRRTGPRRGLDAL